MYHSISVVFRWLAACIALTSISATSSMSQDIEGQGSDPSGAIICSSGPGGKILVLLGFEDIRYEKTVNQWFNFVGSDKNRVDVDFNKIAIDEVYTETGGAYTRQDVEEAITNPLGVFKDEGQFPLFVIQLPYRQRISPNDEKKEFRWIELTTLERLVTAHNQDDGPLSLPDFGSFPQLSSYAVTDFKRQGVWAAAKRTTSSTPVIPAGETADSRVSGSDANPADEAADSLISIAKTVDENQDVRIQSLNALTQLKLGSGKRASVALSFCQIASNAKDTNVDVKKHAIQSIQTILNDLRLNGAILSAVVQPLNGIAQDTAADSILRQQSMQVLVQLKLDAANRVLVAKSLAAIATRTNEQNIEIRSLAINLLVPLVNQGLVAVDAPKNVDDAIRADTIEVLGDLLGNTLELEGTRIEAAKKLMALRPYSPKQKRLMLERFQGILRSTHETDAFKIRAIQWLDQLNGNGSTN